MEFPEAFLKNYSSLFRFVKFFTPSNTERKRKLSNPENPPSKRQKLNSKPIVKHSFEYYFETLKQNTLFSTDIVHLISKLSQGVLITCKRGNKCKNKDKEIKISLNYYIFSKVLKKNGNTSIVPHFFFFLRKLCTIQNILQIIKLMTY